MIEKLARMAMLFDFYGPLLTEKQRQMVALYYDDDLSLTEIAQEYGISRQAIYDLLKRTEAILEDYESKLGLVEKYLLQQEKLARLSQLAEELQEKRSWEALPELVGIIGEINELERK